jgi:hypothetical protein
MDEAFPSSFRLGYGFENNRTGTCPTSHVAASFQLYATQTHLKFDMITRRSIAVPVTIWMSMDHVVWKFGELMPTPQSESEVLTGNLLSK